MLALVHQAVEHGSRLGVSMGDDDHRIIQATATHVHEREVVDPRFRRADRHAARDGVHDWFWLIRRPLREAGEIQV